MKPLLRFGRRCATVVLILVLAAIVFRCLRQHQLRSAVHLSSPDAIESFETVVLGGVQQSMLIRGQHRDGPVILYLHGGPGTPMYPWYRIIGVNTRLEEHFVMVYWEQRGVIHSHANLRPGSIRVADYVGDGCQLAAILQHRFGAPPAILGISWGSFLGLKMVEACGSSIRAFIGSGQAIDFSEADREAVDYIRSEAAKAGDRDTAIRLDRLGPSPWSLDRVAGLVHPLLAKYGAGTAHTPEGNASIPGNAALLLSPEYTVSDLLWTARNPTFVIKRLWDELHRSNVNEVNSLTVPLFFLEGEHDRITPPAIAQRFFDRVQAPRKEWIWFHRSAHVVPADEPVAFGQTVLRLLGTAQAGTVSNK